MDRALTTDETVDSWLPIMEYQVSDPNNLTEAIKTMMFTVIDAWIYCISAGPR